MYKGRNRKVGKTGCLTAAYKMIREKTFIMQRGLLTACMAAPLRVKRNGVVSGLQFAIFAKWNLSAAGRH